MSRQDHDANKLDPLEAEVLSNLKLMTPKMRESLRHMSFTYAELFPARPTLRLVKTAVGGGK